jgi:hypothetical protein
MRAWLQKQSSVRGETVSAVPPRPATGTPERQARAAPAVGHPFRSNSIEPAAASDGALATAERGVRAAGAQLPHLYAIQRSFGRYDLSGVRAHQDGAADVASRRIGASAYTLGDRVAFRAPASLRTAAHEAAHVVQQRGGVDIPGGVGQPGDRHERHADAVAERVVQGRSAEALLDAYAPADSAARPAPRGAAVQMQDDPTLTPHKKNGAVSVYELKEGGKTAAWIDPYKIDFLGGVGWDVFLWAKANGYSSFAGLFIMAHATLESDFGAGNFGDQYKNLFSMMGGPKENKGTAHGRLMKYATYEEGFEAYVSKLSANWSGMVAPATGLYFQDSFTPDQVNQAFRQYNYYGKGGGVYLGDKTADYGAHLFGRMGFLAGPLLAVLAQKIDEVGRDWNLAYQQSDSPDQADAEGWKAQSDMFRGTFVVYGQYLEELRTARAEVATKLAAHKALKKAGTIPAPPP